MKKTYNNLMRVAALSLIWLVWQTAYANNYLVYSVIGDVKQQMANEYVALKARHTITSETRLKIGKESVVTVIDEQNNKLYSLTTTGTHTVQTLIAMAKGGKNYSKQYISYMVKRLFSSESSKLSHPSSYMQTAAAAFRSTGTDSLLLNKLSWWTASLDGATAEDAVVLPQNPVITDYEVTFELMSCATQLPIGKEVNLNTSCYVRVTNSSEYPLYVNVLDIDEHGSKYLVLPVDEAALCAHLLVPPNSMVAFTSEPFEFVESKSKETFLLVATEDPVDFSILMSPIKGNGKNQMKLGLYKMVYETK